MIGSQIIPREIANSVIKMLEMGTFSISVLIHLYSMIRQIISTGTQRIAPIKKNGKTPKRYSDVSLG